MQRLYSGSPEISNDKIIISDRSKIHHIKDVLRLKLGEEIIVFDKAGNEYITCIDSFSLHSLVLRIKGKQPFKARIACQLTVACAIPKKFKFDTLIDKLTQLGVDRIIPLETERVVVKLDRRKKALRVERWSKVVLSASQQSQRNTLPVIEPITVLKEVLGQSKDYDLKLIPTLLGERKPIKEILSFPQPKNILVLIGPEGDFTEEEIELARKSGCIPVSLGELVLRVDTAAIAVASILNILRYEES